MITQKFVTLTLTDKLIVNILVSLVRVFFGFPSLIALLQNWLTLKNQYRFLGLPMTGPVKLSFLSLNSVTLSPSTGNHPDNKNVGWNCCITFFNIPIDWTILQIEKKYSECKEKS